MKANRKNFIAVIINLHLTKISNSYSTATCKNITVKAKKNNVAEKAGKESFAVFLPALPYYMYTLHQQKYIVQYYQH